MPDRRQAMGRDGEALACAELGRRGYEILARRFRTRAGEIDIVARDGPTVVFIEVKTRRSGRFGGPLEAVTWRKRRTIGRVAAWFLARHGLQNHPCRFDVVAVARGEGRAVVTVTRGAFEMPRTAR